MHTIQIPLCTTKYDEQIMEKRFHALSHIHNVLVKHAKKLLKKLKYDTRYQRLLSEYIVLKKKGNLSGTDKACKTQLSMEMKTIRLEMGLSEYGLQSYIKVCGKRYAKCLSSQQVQKEATRVWKGVEKVLFGEGKDIHFKRYMDFDTIGGTSNKNGAKFLKDTFSIHWIGLDIRCKYPKREDEIDYLTESLDADISYCEIKREMFPNGWHYYALVCLKGDAPKKMRSVGNGVMGIDPGTSTIAGVSDTAVVLEELAPDSQKYNKKIVRLQRQMDTSKRLSNPGKYLPNGTINKKNRDRWKFSKTYFKKRRMLKSLYRKKTAYIKQSHERQIKRLLTDSVHFIVEEISYKALQKKGKKTTRQDKVSKIPQKDGTVKQIHKYKKKKRFGRSLNNRAPTRFLIILERKALLYGGSFQTIETKEYRASQYEHDTDSYHKISLKQRTKEIDGHMVQRDLYSAFLIKNTDKDFQHPDREKCICEFQNFVTMQDELIKDMKQQHISMRTCFGF